MPTKDEVQKFSMMIEGLAHRMGSTRLDAILHHCEESGLEVEVASTLISSALKSRISEEAQEANQIKRSSKLPI